MARSQAASTVKMGFWIAAGFWIFGIVMAVVAFMIIRGLKHG